MNFEVDIARGEVRVPRPDGPQTLAIGSPEAFALISRAWLRSGWDAKYVYSFSWLGRPLIQLPDDVLRIQEVVFAVQPDVIVETGVAHAAGLDLEQPDAGRARLRQGTPGVRDRGAGLPVQRGCDPRARNLLAGRVRQAAQVAIAAP